MKGLLEYAIKAFGERIDCTVASPERPGLFEVNEDAEKLCGKKGDISFSYTKIVTY